MKMIIHQVAVGPMQNFSYFAGDAETREIAIVDPGWEAARLVQEAEKIKMTITALLITHTHFDHVKALPDILQLVAVPVFVHRLEVQNLPQGISNTLRTTDEGEVITIGNVKFTCLHTPGHSPGGTCFLSDHHLITGDTLFVGSCGRVDLPGSDRQAMRRSLARLATLPPETIVYPGHDYGPRPTSTIGEERRSNPFVREACA